MSCPETYELLDYVTDVLPPEDKNALKVHLKTCVRCQHRLNTIKPVQGAFLAYFDASEKIASESLRTQTFARLASERKYKLPRKPFLVLVAAAMLFIFFWLGSHSTRFSSSSVDFDGYSEVSKNTDPQLDPKETLLLATVMSSELKEMIHHEEKALDLELEIETDLLAEDYLEEVIFATIEE